MGPRADRAIHGAASRAARHGADATHVLIAARARRDRAAAEHAQRADGQRIGAGDLIELQDIDRGVARQRAGIDGEEKAAGFIVEIARLAIDRLAGDVADTVEPVLHDIALLLRHDAAELQRAELGDRLHAEVVGGNGRGDEPRRRRLERHVARFHPSQDFVLQALVPDVEVVVGVELALAVEVDVDVAAAAPPRPAVRIAYCGLGLIVGKPALHPDSENCRSCVVQRRLRN